MAVSAEERRDRWRSWLDDLSIPLLVAPMTGVSTPELAAASCIAGVIGSFPSHNAVEPGELDEWLDRIDVLTAKASADAGAARPATPLAVNLVLRRSQHRVQADLESIARHQVPIVIASVGSPRPIVGPLHDAGVIVLADVASMRHVRSALDAGVDGLVLLTAGAGGQTGWLNGLAFVRAVRAVYDGPVVLAGGVSDGAALWAAQVLGCDIGYMGTTFIAVEESGAEDAYRSGILAATMDDVELTMQDSGIAANFLRTWDGRPSAAHGYSAGHTVSAVESVRTVADLIEETRRQYDAARERTATILLRT